MIGKLFAVLFLVPNAVFAAYFATQALPNDHAWLEGWWFLAGAALITLIVCIMAKSGKLAWGRGVFFAGVIYVAAGIALILAPEGFMEPATEAVGEAAVAAGTNASNTSTGDTMLARGTEGVVVGGLVGITGFFGAAFGLAIIVGISFVLGALHLLIGTILLVLGARAERDVDIV